MGQPPHPLGDAAAEVVRIERWPSEGPLYGLVVLASLALWGLLAVSLIGFVYALLIGAFFFLAHVGFVAHVRGNGVRLGPDQFPALHERVVELSRRAGLKQAPEAYLVQAGGSLNALATRFLGSGVIVLFSELVDACGDDHAARDMVVGHELGHLAAGHLDGRWFLLPGLLVPFLGSAYSQACEYTCDRYGAALCGDARGALTGLGILAAGGSHGRQVDFRALARQRETLDTGWMTLGRWLMTHPPLCLRVSALEPALAEEVAPSTRGTLRALAIVGVFLLLPATGLAVFGALFVSRLQSTLQEAGVPPPVLEEPMAFQPPADVAAAGARARSDMEALAEIARAHRDETGSPPPDPETLQETWRARHGSEPPLDPFDGFHYGYQVDDRGFWLWSSGPDGESGTADDIAVEE